MLFYEKRLNFLKNKIEAPKLTFDVCKRQHNASPFFKHTHCITFVSVTTYAVDISPTFCVSTRVPTLLTCGKSRRSRAARTSHEKKARNKRVSRSSHPRCRHYNHKYTRVQICIHNIKAIVFVSIVAYVSTGYYIIGKVQNYVVGVTACVLGIIVVVLYETNL